MDALLLVKASLLLASALVAERRLRRRPASARHALWSLGFAAILALPMLSAVLPALEIPVPSIPGGVRRPANAAGPAEAGRYSGPGRSGSVRLQPDHDSAPGSVRLQPDHAGGTAQPEPTRREIPIVSVLLVIWILGATAAVAVLGVSLVRVWQLARSAHEPEDAGWRSRTAAIAARLGLRTPVRLLVSPHVTTPMAGGLLRPVVFLPPAATDWSDERRDVVLTHEIAHLARRDPLRHVLARLALAAYWFHPLAWAAARRAVVAREQACDETVLALGTRPSVYARVLLDLADAMQPRRPLAALPIVERSRLEKRVMTILTSDVRPAAPRRVFLPVAGAMLIVLPVATVRPLATAADVPAETTVAARPAAPPAPAGFSVARPGPKDAPNPAPSLQVDRSAASTCWTEPGRGSSFTGSMSMSQAGGQTVIHEQIGWRGADRVIMKSFGDLSVCMLAEGSGNRERDERPSQWLATASRVMLESRRGTAVERLELTRQPGGAVSTSWQVAGRERPFDRTAEAWRDRMLAALDTTWEISTVRGQVSSLRGEISSIYGERSSLQGEISSLQGHVSSLSGEISSVRGEESNLRGEISSIRGHVSSLRGAVSSEQGSISSLNANRYGADASDRTRIQSRIAEHDAEIARLDREIRDYNEGARVAAVEKQIAALDVEGKVAAIEREIRTFDLAGKSAEIKRRIDALDVERRIAAIEKQIDSLDADGRVRRLEGRRDGELKQLEAAIAAIRSSG